MSFVRGQLSVVIRAWGNTAGSPYVEGWRSGPSSLEVGGKNREIRGRKSEVRGSRNQGFLYWTFESEELKNYEHTTKTG